MHSLNYALMGAKCHFNYTTCGHVQVGDIGLLDNRAWHISPLDSTAKLPIFPVNHMRIYNILSFVHQVPAKVAGGYIGKFYTETDSLINMAISALFILYVTLKY